MLRSIQIRFAAAAIAALVALTGCAANQQAATTGAKPEAGASQPEQGTGGEPNNAGSSNIRTVEHALGKTDIEGTPAKIVTLYQGANDAVLALGVKPVGAVESVVEKPWYLYIRDRMEGVVNVGSDDQPNLEEIYKLKPDLIIGTKTRHEKIYEQLSQIAPTVISEEKDNWKATLRLMAEAMNKEAEEAKFLEEWNAKVAEFKQKMGDKLNAKVSIVDFRADHARIFYGGHSGLVLKELGLSRPDQQQDKEEQVVIKLTSKETIPQMDGDIIFDLTSMDRDDGRVNTRQEWTSHPLWKNLKAVQNGQVYQVDTVIWNNGGGPIAAMKMVDDVYNYFGLK